MQSSAEKDLQSVATGKSLHDCTVSGTPAATQIACKQNQGLTTTLQDSGLTCERTFDEARLSFVTQPAHFDGEMVELPE